MPPDVLYETVHVFLELPREPGLSDAGDPEHGHEMRFLLLRRCVEELLDDAQLAFSSHERRLEAARLQRPRTTCGHSERAKERQRLCLAFELVATGVGICDRDLGHALSRLAHQDGSGIGKGLDSRSSVDEISGDHTLALCAERDRGLAAEDACTGLKLRRSHLLAECRNGCDQVERCAHSALSIVLLRDRRPPHRHHGIADELLDGAAVERDQPLATIEVAREKLAHLLGIA